MTLIKFTEKCGSELHEHYVNANEITEARYNDSDGSLQMVVRSPNVPAGYRIIDLTGQDAQSALKTLQSLP